MLKTVANGDALRIQIHPRLDWRIGFNFLILTIWGYYFFSPWHGFENRTTIDHSASRGTATMVLVFLAFLMILYITLRSLFYFEIVTVTPDTLRIQGRLLSFTLSDRQYENSRISNLRYEEWAGRRYGPQNGIRFLSNGQTITFARQADPSDSWDLIDRAREVYPFKIPAPASSPATTPW
jgi:hypothetical protein